MFALLAVIYLLFWMVLCFRRQHSLVQMTVYPLHLHHAFTSLVLVKALVSGKDMQRAVA